MLTKTEQEYITSLCQLCFNMAKDKGWHDSPRRPLEIHALIHSEISEATEEVRNKKDSLYLIKEKPCGELVELADAVIRIMDYCGLMNWDLGRVISDKLAYNSSRPYRHGGKAA